MAETGYVARPWGAAVCLSPFTYDEQAAELAAETAYLGSDSEQGGARVLREGIVAQRRRRRVQTLAAGGGSGDISHTGSIGCCLG